MRPQGRLPPGIHHRVAHQGQGLTVQAAEALFQHAPGMMHVADEDGVIRRVNAAWLTTVGCAEEQAVGRPVSDFIRPVEPITGDDGTERELVTANGSTLDVIVLSGGYADDSGTKLVISCVTDISARREARRKLANMRHFYEQILENLPAQVAVCDLEGRYLFVNAAGSLDTAERSWLIGKTDVDYCRARGIEERVSRMRRAAMEQCILDRKITTLEEDITTFGGESLNFLRMYSPLLDSKGRVTRVIVYSVDITERKRTGDQLHAARTRYRQLIEWLPLITYEAQFESGRKLEFISPQVERLLGIPPASFVEDPGLLLKQVHPHDRERVFNELNQMAATGRQFRLEYRMVAADSRVLWFRDEGLVFRHPLTGLRTVQGFMLDITETKRAAEALARLAAIVESSDDAILSETLDGVVTTCNPASEKTFGYRPAELIGQSVNLLIPPEKQAESAEVRALIGRGERTRSYETVRVRRDGKHIDVALTVSPLYDSTKRVVGVSVIARDVTAKKNLERQLRESQKLEALGRLAGGVAHDFNNLLTAITGYNSMVMEELGAEHSSTPDLHEIEKAADSAALLTSQLLAFSRAQVLKPQVIDLNGVIDSMHKLLGRLIGEAIHLEVRPDKGLGPVFVDMGQVEQVVLNLAINARDAMPRGGRLTIETRAVEFDMDSTGRPPELPPGAYASVIFTDTGHGIPAEVLPFIFEPFFTTKDPGKGTGLGLATVYGIIRQSGGAIKVESKPELGTVFKVYLPRTEGPEVPVKVAAAEASGSLKGSETVLLVEDEEAVRNLARQVLRRAGYMVLTAREPDEALLISDKYAGDIHLLLTDVILPGMNGLELADRIRRTRPSTGVLFMSGYTSDALADQGLTANSVALLQKPFRVEALQRIVREVLDLGQGGAE